MKKILLEALMIVMSVLLALFINEWKSNKNNQNETVIMVENIMAEISNNKELTERLIPYHKAAVEKLQLIALKDSLSEFLLKDGYFELSSVAPRGVKQGDFQDIAWSIAKEEKIANRISYDESQLLFSAYEQQFRVLKTIDRIIDILSAREIHRQNLIEESVIVLVLEWNELIAQEEELLRRYSITLEKMEGK